MACYAVKGSVATLPALRAPLTAPADAASGRYEDGSGGQAKEAELGGRGTRGSNEACELRRVQRHRDALCSTSHRTYTKSS